MCLPGNNAAYYLDRSSGLVIIVNSKELVDAEENLFKCEQLIKWQCV